MTRAKRAVHMAFMDACRFLARFVPPLLLHALLVPYERVRGARLALVQRELPLRHVPPRPDDEPPGFMTRWRYQSRNYERWLATVWPELWKKPPWSSRFRVDNGEVVDRLLADGPVVLATLHTSWLFFCAAWLLHRGVLVGSAISQADQWERVKTVRDSRYWSHHEGLRIFLRGDTRAMLRFLTPGRCFMVQVDFGQGEVIDVEWGGSKWPMATGAFRLARLANATVVPIIALDDGLWRYRVHVGAAVPAALISSGNNAASAAHVLNELMPLIAQVPDQLMGWRPRPPQRG